MLKTMKLTFHVSINIVWIPQIPTEKTQIILTKFVFIL